MKYQSRWVNISGKVFVSQDEIDALVEAGHDDFYDVDIKTEEDAFRLLAEQKISGLFPSDDPFKYDCTEILPSLR